MFKVTLDPGISGVAAESSIVNRALTNTALYAVGQLYAATPKRTGRLAGAWQAQPSRRTAYLVNNTPYAGIVERRVGYVRRTVPQIQQRLAKELADGYR